jgi:hypothetical protein
MWRRIIVQTWLAALHPPVKKPPKKRAANKAEDVSDQG